MTGNIEFAGIGTPRSGTTWLYKNLRRHPEIFLPPVKELRHFGGYWPPEKKAARHKSLMAKCSDPLDLQFLEKWRNYDKSDDLQYLSLFDIGEDRIRGEVSPAYCAMDKKGVKRFRSVVGNDVKIIYLTRDPIDRDWSFAKRYLHRRLRNYEVRALGDYQKYLSKEKSRRRANYVETLKLWRTGHEERFFLGFYEDLIADPVKFLRSVCLFLGVRYEQAWFEETLASRPTSTKNRVDMPEGLLPFLAEINLPMLTELAKVVPNEHTQRWLERARDIHAKT